MSKKKLKGLASGFCIHDVGKNMILVASRRFNLEDWGLPRGFSNPLEGRLPCAIRGLRESTGVNIKRHLISLRDDYIFAAPQKRGEHTTFYVPVHLEARKHFDHAKRQPNGGGVRWVKPEFLIHPGRALSEYHREMLDFFNILSSEELPFNDKSDTMPIESLLFREKDSRSHYQKLTQLLQQEIQLNGQIQGKNVQMYKKLLGPQSRTKSVDGTRYWIWEQNHWRVFVANDESPFIEVNSLLDPEAALDAYEDYLTQMQEKCKENIPTS